MGKEIKSKKGDNMRYFIKKHKLFCASMSCKITNELFRRSKIHGDFREDIYKAINKILLEDKESKILYIQQSKYNKKMDEFIFMLRRLSNSNNFQRELISKYYDTYVRKEY